jgi:hypothetical protein
MHSLVQPMDLSYSCATNHDLGIYTDIGAEQNGCRISSLGR